MALQSITKGFVTLHNFETFGVVGVAHHALTLFPSGDYVARQVQTWTKQYRASETSTIPAMEKLIEWLPLHLPRQQTLAVVHGDFRYMRRGVILRCEKSWEGHPKGKLSSWSWPNLQL